jgi:putative transposase
VGGALLHRRGVALGGLVTFYVLFFIHVGSRRVWIAGGTPQPHGGWMAQQARNFAMVMEDRKLCGRYLVHDGDARFADLDRALKSDQLRILKTPPHAPQCNAYAERHVREIRETLDQMILLGESHLGRVLCQIQGNHNACRPHQGLGNLIPLGFDYPTEAALPDQVQCEQALGGLLNHYSLRKVA